MSKYYTYISVNRKAIRVEETEKEHEARVRRMRAIEYRKKQEEVERHIGLHKGIAFICTGCGREIPSTYQSRSGDFYCKFCGRCGPKYENGPAI